MDDYPNLTEAVGRVLARHREQAGLSKRRLAQLSSVDRVYLLQLEQGRYRPTLNALFFLADALGLTVGDLVEEIERERRSLCGEQETAGASPETASS